MKQPSRSAGFSAIEVLIIIAVIALVGLLGVIGYNRWQADMDSKAGTANQAESTATEVPEVNTTEDLDTALEAVDQADATDDNSTDAKQLDGQSSAF